LASALASVALSNSNDLRARPSGFEGVFRLQSNNGEMVDSRAMRGRPYAVFFGFTQCPAVCSTTLLEMVDLLRVLGREAAEFKVFFITLDPERDTAGTLTNFLSSIGPAIVGLTGSSDEIAQAAKSFRVYYRKVATGGDYMIDHTALVYLVDRQGRVVDVLSFDEREDIALKKLKNLLLENPLTPRFRVRFDSSGAERF
jgi:cytochrome oxidase Cu insertion factor (SCO1/SenC/PrrC family)